MNEQLTKKFTAHAAGEDGETNWRNAELCAEIAQEHAIEFGKWIEKNAVVCGENEYAHAPTGKYLTIEELYTIFLKEKEGK